VTRVDTSTLTLPGFSRESDVMVLAITWALDLNKESREAGEAESEPTSPDAGRGRCLCSA